MDVEPLGPNHVEVAKDQTFCQVSFCLDSSGVVSVFPECTFPLFACIELLSRSSCLSTYQLEVLGNDLLACINNK